MADRELFVICNNCGSEVSPYVTECPYCGHRLRKRAPDLKKVKKQEEKDEKRAQKKRDKLRAVYEGGGEPKPGSYLSSRSQMPIATIVLIVGSVIVSLVWRLDSWLLNLVFSGDLPGHLWQLLTAPLVQLGFGYGFVCLTGAAMFGSGLEARYGPVVLVLAWAVCGAFGVLAEYLLAPIPFTSGAYAVAVGLMTAWLIVVVTREDLRDFDGIGLGAVGAVLLALPIVTDEASVWTLLGGLVGGGLVGAVLMRVRARAV